ncbi:MAG TPA: HEAT repeat domain-containing protein [Methanoregulaceae archaeon]|nr:HEAT repeat domain-containing protein [Methanoregulaceae archaeon]HPD10878.1 HEAT repeat domain-containing protein [Methanoregulaceae archaeon]HRT16023.1 HEAT repeat domain-containing protein [Methanoregulaceae archaeon]HRU31529.1 HEAT repeat domain-containing protein [Methanoregulaceae archaeon]
MERTGQGGYLAAGFGGQVLKLTVIGIFSVIALAVTLFAFFSDETFFGIANIILLPHLYLIPIILFAFWYPKRGLQITIIIIVTLVVLTFVFYYRGMIQDPLFMLLNSGVDLMIVFALALYAKDRDLIEGILKDIMGQYRGSRGRTKGDRLGQAEKWEGLFSLDVSEIVQALRTGDEDDREEAARALGELRDPEAVEPLTAALGDQSRYVRREAAKALGAIGEERCIPPLIKALRDEDRSAREGAAEGLAMMGTMAINSLARALDDPDWHVRMGAVVALRIIGDRTVMPGIIRAAGDENRFVRREAIKGLGRIGGNEVLQPLADALTDEDTGVRLRAAGALGRTGRDDAIAPLIGALGDRDSGVRLRAIQALEEIGSPAARAVLEQHGEQAGKD